MKNGLDDLKHIVGKMHMLTAKKQTLPYRKGFQEGFGEAMCVVLPGTLVELWCVAQCCVEHDMIILMQAANTGLTGGSVPDGDYDRDVVIVNTMRLHDLHLLDEGKQVIAFPGSRLYELEKALAPYGREPHSVIGSSCIGASIVGGVCNNSGGALINRGPAYTEMALYGRIDENQQLVLVNELGVELGKEPEEILTALQNKSYSECDIQHPDKATSDTGYQQRIRDVNAQTPARFNNDASRLFGASGCAGKLIVFAVRLATFEKPKKERVFYIGTNDTDELSALRRSILSQFEHLPIAGEYMHKDCFDLADKYGKDTFVAINRLGSENIPKLFAFKSKVDNLASRIPFLPSHFSDTVLQALSHLFPDHLPKRIRDFREQYDHHLILQVADETIDEAQVFLSDFFADSNGDFFECDADEGNRALLHRFVAGGAIVRTWMMKQKHYGECLSLDIALRRNETEWFEKLPPELDELIAIKSYYAHFLCHVMHQDYIVKKGVDAQVVKKRLLQYFDEKGAEYPAEHNVGTQYVAKPALATFYRDNDPTNSLNPGIGKTAKYKNWSETKCCDKP